PGSDIDGRSADLKSTLTCQVSVRSGEVSCGAAEGALGGGASPAVIGDQGLHVQLESSNIRYDAGSQVFSADISIRNLLDQTLGSSDVSTRDPNGVGIFFVRAPGVTEGRGSVPVTNADGRGDFWGPDSRTSS